MSTVVRLAKPGLRSVVAESVLVRHQLLILNRGRQPVLPLPDCLQSTRSTFGRARDPEIPRSEAEQAPVTRSPNRLAQFIRSMMPVCGIFVSIAEGIDRRPADFAWTH